VDIAKRSKESAEGFLGYQGRETADEDSGIVGVGRGELLAVGTDEISKNGSSLCVMFPRFLVDGIWIVLGKNLSELGLAE
jgi:hypothetical protein